MNRTTRVIVAVVALLLFLGGTAVAVRAPAPGNVVGLHEASEAPESEAPEKSDAPETEGPEAPPTAEKLADLVNSLKLAGITADASTLSALAQKYGLGGAVRIEAWAKASGKSVAEISAMRDAGAGWGQIARQLNAAATGLHLSPGIGWIMSNGHSQGHAN
jgi:hypothetical protein